MPRRNRYLTEKELEERITKWSEDEDDDSDDECTDDDLCDSGKIDSIFIDVSNMEIAD